MAEQPQGITVDEARWPVFAISMGTRPTASEARALVVALRKALERKEPFIATADYTYLELLPLGVLQALWDDFAPVRAECTKYLRGASILVPNPVVRGIGVAAVSFLKLPVSVEVLGSRAEVEAWIDRERVTLGSAAGSAHKR